MEQQEILAAVEAERLKLCTFLDGLEPADWSAPSECAGWTVREVVAHLTIPTRATVAGVIAGAIRARGDFHRMADRQARARAAAFQPPELIAQLRETAGSPRRMPGSAPMDPLADVLVHGQDIARPLGRSLTMPPHLAVAALGHVVGSGFTGAPRRIAHLRLVATDETWAHGPGPDEVRGPAADLLLVAYGRPSGLARLSGPGAGLLAPRLAPATA